MFTKRIVFAFSALFLLSIAFCNAQETIIPNSGPTTPKGWYDDFDTALKATQIGQKKLYVLFTGSDWCGWCKKLKADVLETGKFKEVAADKLILLYLDSPSPKAKMPEELLNKNRKLAEKFGVRGFPTSLILDAQGKEIGKIVGAPGDFLDQLKAAIK
ncbi:MAG: thioredoxin family protein [Lentisphaeria bacterium]